MLRIALFLATNLAVLVMAGIAMAVLTALESPLAMAGALNRLRAMRDAPSQLPPGLSAFGIRGEGLNKLMATHPPLEERIARLQESA